MKYIVFCLLLVGLNVTAQSFEPIISVAKDSVFLGEHFDVTLAVRYPKNKQLIFADSTHNFGDFEFVKKTYSTTQSNDSMSLDSAVYTFSTFELGKALKLAIPIYVITPKDSIEVVSDSISIFIKEVIAELPATIELKEDTNAAPLEYEFDYILWGIVLGVSIWLTAACIITFGRPLIVRFKKKRLTNQHQKFEDSFKRKIEKEGVSKEEVEEALNSWKKHLSYLTKQPYTSYSTTEIHQLANDEQLKNDLRVIDRTLYSSHQLNSVAQLQGSMLGYAQMKFNKRIEGLANGRK